MIFLMPITSFKVTTSNVVFKDNSILYSRGFIEASSYFLSKILQQPVLRMVARFSGGFLRVEQLSSCQLPPHAIIENCAQLQNFRFFKMRVISDVEAKEMNMIDLWVAF